MVDAREVITAAIPCNIVYGRPQAADEIIRALAAAGFRILGPGELDVETVEKCAQVAERAGKPAGASDGGTYVVGSATDAATAIRALASGESR